MGYDFKRLNAKVIFDNGGGLTLQLEGEWAHYYQDMTQAAEDFINYCNDGNFDGWEGHEDEALELEPEDDQIRNGGYRVFLDEDIYALAHNPEELENVSWGNIKDFCKAILEPEKDDFRESIRDWQADAAPEHDDLEIGEPEIDEETHEWVAIARDEKKRYLLRIENGFITINYLDTK